MDITRQYTQQGFIQALAEANYGERTNGYPNEAHTEADVGGEFMLAYELDLSYLVYDWYLPVQDLQKISQMPQLGWPLLPAHVYELCNLELYAEVHAIKDLVGKLLFPTFAKEAPWMVDQLQDYWMGGVNNNAVWTDICWLNLMKWLKTGKADGYCIPEMNYNPASAEQAIRHQKAMERAQHRMRQILKEHMAQVNIQTTRTGRGTTFTRTDAPKAAFLEENKPASPHPTMSQPMPSVASQNCVNIDQASVVFSVNQSYSYLGQSLAIGDWNGDGLDDVLLGAPGYVLPSYPDDGGNPIHAQIGAAFLVYGQKGLNKDSRLRFDVSQHLDDPSSMSYWLGSETGARFGAAVLSLDFNADGFLDLVASAPGIGTATFTSTGAVYVYLGYKGSNGFPALPSTPSITIASTYNFTNLGTTLKACDVNGDGHDDLIIGSPYAPHSGNNFSNPWNHKMYQAGAVSIFLSGRHDSKNKSKNNVITLDYQKDSDWFSEGEQLYAWFGNDISCYALPNQNQTLLLVSAPLSAYATDSSQRKVVSAVGSIYLFSLSHRDLFSQRLLLLNGSSRFDQFGMSATFSRPFASSYSQKTRENKATSVPSDLYIVAGMPTATSVLDYFIHLPQAGSAVLLSVSSLLEGPSIQNLNQTSRGTIKTRFIGDVSYGRLGWKVVGERDLDGDGWDEVWVSQTLTRTEAGAAFLFRGGKTFPSGDTRELVSNSAWCAFPNHLHSRFGEEVAFLKFSDSTIAATDILLAGPRDSAQTTHGGQVALYLQAFSHQ
ncbi:Glycosylphosphatidylinositol specific phospholipase D1 [Balamuthia mandrillaris]